MSEIAAEVQRHYNREGLLDRVLAALKEAGKDVDHLMIDDLAPIESSTRAAGLPRRSWRACWRRAPAKR